MYFTFLQNTLSQPAVSGRKYFQPAIGPKSIDSNSRSLSLADRQPLRTQTQPASQTSQPSRPSQSRQAASLDMLYFYKIPYFTFLPLPAARQPNQPAQPAQPTRPAQPALDRSCSLYFVFSQNIPGLPVQTGRQPGYFLFLQNTVFYIFTKYRILHFYKIPLHRPEDRGPLRTPPSPVS